MDSDTPDSAPQFEPSTHLNPPAPPDLSAPGGGDPDYRGLRWIFIGPRGLRAGWSIAIFAVLFCLLLPIFDSLAIATPPIGSKREFAAKSLIAGEFAAILAMLGAAALVAAIEQRRIEDYNLRGPRRFRHFLVGVASGFAGLSALVGALAWGSWIRFGPVALHGQAIAVYGAEWGCAFVLVGCFEEGIMRCYLLFTLARGINFWWAICLVGAMCADLVLRSRAGCARGVYTLAIIGLVPSAVLFARKIEGSGFWYAAWVTSTFFAFGHIGNSGETWLGIFAAGAIGAVFCASVRITGSAWWAIGCHAAWDWAETFFYGTADSGVAAPGHYLSATPAGSALLSGGSDGPEGSVLALAIIALLLALVLLYGRKKTEAAGAAMQVGRAVG
jgi:uncharacterized protein